MSEHITAHHGKYKKKYTTAWMDDGVSEEAHKSTVTKISKVAEVSQKVELQDTSRSVKGFSLTYDRIQAEFQQKLIEAYTQMRTSYMEQYQDNFN